MRLLVLVEYFPPVLGHDLRIYELARRFPTDWDVRFLVAPSLRQLMSGAWPTRSAGTADRRIAAEPIGLPTFVRRLWLKAWWAAFAFTFGFVLLGSLRVAKRARPDVVIANYPSPYTGLVAYALARMQGRPFLVDFCDDIAAYIGTLIPSPTPPVRGLLRWVQDFLIRRSAGLPVVTSGLRQYALQHRTDAARVALVPNGVDLNLFHPEGLSAVDDPNGFHRSVLRCFYGGSLELWAGSSLLIDIARKALSEHVPIEITVAGNPLRDGGEPLPANVHHLGYLDKAQMARAIRASDCVLVPLRPGQVARGTSPVKLFEGLAAGKPCVCSKVEGVCDVIVDRENGLLVDSFDPEAWLTAIQSLAHDEALRRRLSEGAKVVSGQYDWQELANRFADIVRAATTS